MVVLKNEESMEACQPSEREEVCLMYDTSYEKWPVARRIDKRPKCSVLAAVCSTRSQELD
jgi:hypothetical protein